MSPTSKVLASVPGTLVASTDAAKKQLSGAIVMIGSCTPA